MGTPHPFPHRDEGEVLVLGGCATLSVAYEGPLVSLSTFHCLHDGEELRAERVHLTPTLAFGFAGASLLRSGSRSVQLDTAHALWHQAGQGYSPSHPWGCGCRGCYVRVAPEIGEELSRRTGASRLRGFVAPAAAQLALRRLLVGIRRGTVHEPLAIEEALVRIVDDVLAFPGDGAPPRRASTREVHERCVQRAQGYLHEHLRERVRLAEVARAACASPDHLTRLFRRETGATLHDYLVRLRLAVALDAVLETEVDLTELALDLGFASHSHLTYAFRRRFGVPPGAVRRELAPAACREAAATLRSGERAVC